jgi:hypothetical protein
MRSPGPGSSFLFLFAVLLPTLFPVATGAQTRIRSDSQSSPVTTTTAPGHPSATQGPTGSTQEPTQVLYYQPPSTPFMCGGGSSGGAAEERESLVDKRGPQIPPIFSMSSFSVMGFVRGSWPVVFDYFLEQDSLLVVVIAPEGGEPILYRLNGKKGHWQSRLNVPAELGPQPQVARYAIHSFDEGIGQVSASHLHVHGIAAGPKAVGSIGIDQVSFEPAAIHLAQGEKAHYTFHSISDFKNVQVEFVRIAMSNGQVIAARVGGKDAGAISRNQQHGGDWDGKGDAGGKLAKGYSPQVQLWLKDGHGQHLLQVRAWWGEKDGGDWVTALSEEFVTVE